MAINPFLFLYDLAQRLCHKSSFQLLKPVTETSQVGVESLKKINSVLSDVVDRLNEGGNTEKQEGIQESKHEQLSMEQVATMISSIAIMMDQAKQTPEGRQIMNEFKFSKEKIDSMNSIADLDGLLNEAKSHGTSQPKIIINRIQERIDFLVKFGSDQEEKREEVKVLGREWEEVLNLKNTKKRERTD